MSSIWTSEHVTFRRATESKQGFVQESDHHTLVSGPDSGHDYRWMRRGEDVRMMAKKTRGGVEATWRDGDRSIEFVVIVLILYSVIPPDPLSRGALLNANRMSPSYFGRT